MCASAIALTRLQARDEMLRVVEALSIYLKERGFAVVFAREARHAIGLNNTRAAVALCDEAALVLGFLRRKRRTGHVYVHLLAAAEGR